jgi:hypothetical protein
LDELEAKLKKNMFLGGFSVNQEDKDSFEKVKKFDPLVYPNLDRWMNYMKN